MPTNGMHHKGESGAGIPLPDFASMPEKYGWPAQNERGYRIREELYGIQRPLRVIAIGAGCSGICIAKNLPEMVENVKLTIYEKNSDYGGTWYENRYPGCACDVPSAVYQFSWARNPSWSKYYSPGTEILQYLKNIIKRFNLAHYFRLNHMITGAYWDPKNGVWEVYVQNLLTGEILVDYAEIFINSGGILNAWKWPEIEGLTEFQGKLCHTANYDLDTTLEGKRVAVIGIGSSGVQVISNIADKVSRLYAWVRSPTWATAGIAQKYAGPNGENFDYSEEQKTFYRQHPVEYLTYCKKIDEELGRGWSMILNGTPEADEARKFSEEHMKRKLGSRTDIIEHIIPKDFGVGCRRPTPGNGFLEALTLPNVTTFLEPLQKITEKGFLDNYSTEHEVDVIICATGFDTSWVPRFPVVANGQNVQDIQRKRPISYLSVSLPDIPNYFTIGGPYFSFGHGAFTSAVELVSNYIIQFIHKFQKENLKSVMPSQKATHSFLEHADLWLKRTAWSGPCSSWFKGGKIDGTLTMFPGTRLVMMDLLAIPRYEDYVIEHWSDNCFSFLGNGFSTADFDGTDPTYYLGSKDNPGSLLPEDDAEEPKQNRISKI